MEKHAFPKRLYPSTTVQGTATQTNNFVTFTVVRTSNLAHSLWRLSRQYRRQTRFTRKWCQGADYVSIQSSDFSVCVSGWNPLVPERSENHYIKPKQTKSVGLTSLCSPDICSRTSHPFFNENCLRQIVAGLQTAHLLAASLLISSHFVLYSSYANGYFIFTCNHALYRVFQK